MLTHPTARTPPPPPPRHKRQAIRDKVKLGSEVATPKYLINHLDRQLRFLETSGFLYDEGHRDEGIRIATVIRVLVHDTPSSHALLHQLGAEAIDLQDMCRSIPEAMDGPFLGLANRAFTAYGEVLIPFCDAGGPGLPRRLPDWWNQTVGIDEAADVRLTRRDIVLAAVNKDGGAHIDLHTQKYSRLARPGYFDKFVDLGGPLIDAHLVALRHMAFEILNSPQLVALAASADPLPHRIPHFPAPSYLRMNISAG